MVIEIYHSYFKYVNVEDTDATDKHIRQIHTTKGWGKTEYKEGRASTNIETYENATLKTKAWTIRTPIKTKLSDIMCSGRVGILSILFWLLRCFVYSKPRKKI
jgi:hypothetical protein